MIPEKRAPINVGPITRTDIVRYQGASGDMQPLHHDDEVARRSGFPGVFSVGMYQAGLLGSWLAEWFGDENVRSYRMRFKAQVWPGDTLTLDGEIVGTSKTETGVIVDVELRCTNQNGDTAVQGWSTCFIPDSGQCP